MIEATDNEPQTDSTNLDPKFYADLILGVLLGKLVEKGVLSVSDIEDVGKQLSASAEKASNGQEI